ncbi:hypothetical protein ABK040_010941 [Willaertia magna]
MTETRSNDDEAVVRESSSSNNDNNRINQSLTRGRYSSDSHCLHFEMCFVPHWNVTYTTENHAIVSNLERTMIAYVRTSLLFIATGFVMLRILFMKNNSGNNNSLIIAFITSLLFIFIGVFIYIYSFIRFKQLLQSVVEIEKKEIMVDHFGPFLFTIILFILCCLCILSIYI